MAPSADAARFHSLPSEFSSAPPTDPPHRKRTRLALTLASITVAAAAIGSAQWGASVTYDTALTDHETAVAATEHAARDLGSEITYLESLNTAAGAILAADTRTLMPSGSHESLASSLDEAQAAASAGRELAAMSLDAAPPKPLWFWELLGAADKLESLAVDANAQTARLRSEEELARDESDAVQADGVAALSAAADAAAAFEKAHVNARNLDIIALRDAANAVQRTALLNSDGATRFKKLEAAAVQVIASERAELEERSGPLEGDRSAVEAFARSLAPGVLMDFDWARIVNDVGEGGSMGGYTTWWYDKGGYATIEFSDSVARQWPSARSKALVAHEVGHAISVKCLDAYDTSTQDSIEKWATGWAISMGHTDDANGVWAYGYPPQSYIDAAASCR